MRSNVKLILLEDVEDLGLAGEEVNVASGYARNYLLPRNLGVKASPGAARMLAARREKIEKQRADELTKTRETAAKIEEIEISIPMQASEDNQLYGSVNDRVIAEKLAENGIEIEHHRIKLEEPIKELGMFKVEIKLHHDINATAKIWVVRAS